MSHISCRGSATFASVLRAPRGALRRSCFYSVSPLPPPLLPSMISFCCTFFSSLLFLLPRFQKVFDDELCLHFVFAELLLTSIFKLIKKILG
jgi:hypothetical protein